MERLTERWGKGYVWVKNHDFVSAAYRLADYEDTRLTPEEITAMRHTLDEYHKLADPLLRAQADGRLVVLPCKVGDTVWRIKRTFEEYPDRSKPYIEPSGFLLQDVFNISKTVFLTREEAESALEAMKDV